MVTEKSTAPAELPINFITVGEVAPDDVKIYIKQSVYKALEKYSLEDTKHERGTILLGNYYEELDKMHVVITDYIEAKYTDASAATLTFTHETWDYVNKTHDEKYPDTRILGWQHTHPGYGIFLSGYDLFIQENFFNLPFQIAYVIDPVQHIRGFFQWKNGKIEKLNGFYVYDEIGKSIKLSTESEAKASKKQAAPSKSSTLLLVLALLLSLICLVLLLTLRKTMSNQVSALQDTITAQSATIEEQASELADQAQQLDTLSSQINSTVSTTADSAVESDENYYSYTVKSGDTLADICVSLNVDLWKNKAEILELNNLPDENTIMVGQQLLIPKV